MHWRHWIVSQAIPKASSVALRESGSERRRGKVTTLVTSGVSKIIVGGVNGASERSLDARNTALVTAAGALVEGVEGCVSSSRLVHGEIDMCHFENPPICALEGVLSQGSNTSAGDARLSLSFGMA
jgi:hypothetical protein